MAEEDKSAEPRTTATKQPAIKKTTAKSAAAKTASATSQTPSKRTAAAKKPTASTARKRTTKAKAAAPQTVGEAPAPVIERTSPEQFGRVNVLDITPTAENGLFPHAWSSAKRSTSPPKCSSKAVPGQERPCPCVTHAAARLNVSP